MADPADDEEAAAARTASCTSVEAAECVSSEAEVSCAWVEFSHEASAVAVSAESYYYYVFGASYVYYGAG